MLYEKVSTDLNFVDREQKVLEFWKQNEIFKKSVKLREGNPRFTLKDLPRQTESRISDMLRQDQLRTLYCATEL